MKEINLQNWFSYHAQSFDNVLAGLKFLVENNDKWLKKTSVNGKKLLFYCKAIFEQVKNYNKTDLENLELDVIKYLNSNLLQNFIDHPDDKNNVDSFAKQIFFIYSALGNTLPVEVYSKLEMQEIIEGEYVLYDDNTFVYSLNKIFNDQDKFGEYQTLLEKYFFREKPENLKYEMEWEDALIYSLFILFFWKNFSFATKEMQETLLKNYFYTAIVCGVPVKSILERFLSVGTVEELNERRQMFFDALQESREEVPLDANFTEWKKLIEVIKAFSVRIKGANSGFEQEEFLKTFYNNQEGRDIYRSWLREVLNIVFSLEK